jgi:hypothetical protein
MDQRFVKALLIAIIVIQWIVMLIDWWDGHYSSVSSLSFLAVICGLMALHKVRQDG